MRIFLAAAFVLLLPLVTLAADEAPAKDAASTATEPKNLFKPTADVESWILELTEGGKGEMAAEDDAIVFTTSETTGTDWHVQAYQTGLDLEDGKEYVVRFKMKSPDEASLLLVGQIHEPDWHEIGLHEEVSTDDDYDDYEYEFTADNTSEGGNDRIGFVLGIDKGKVYVKDLTLTEKESD